METRTYTERSNARRAARAAGVDPNLVFSTEDGFTFPQPRPEQGNDVDPDASAHQRKADAAAADDGLDIPAFCKRPAPTPEEREALTAKVKRANSPEREIIMPKRDKTKTKTAKRESGADKNATLMAMLKKGATVDDLTKALGWLPHTLRARISRLHKPKSKGGEGLKIERERVDGVTSYRIAA